MKQCIDCNTNPPAKGRRVCSRCKNRRYEARHPIRVAYNRLKGHAKERNKVFTISFEYYSQFCTEVEYIAKKGRSSTSLHVDRIIEELGYIEGNLQALENGNNVRKYKAWKQLNENNESEFHTVTIKPQQISQDGVPF